MGPLNSNSSAREGGSSPRFANLTEAVEETKENKKSKAGGEQLVDVDAYPE